VELIGDLQSLTLLVKGASPPKGRVTSLPTIRAPERIAMHCGVFFQQTRILFSDISSSSSMDRWQDVDGSKA
jgi:hypothetical protein